MSVVNYATLTQLKSYLGISGTQDDLVLQLLLDWAYNTLNNLLQVESMNLTTGEDTVEAKKIYNNDWYYGYNIFLRNKPVTAITKINWTTYEGVKGTDYLITYDRKATIKDLMDYIATLSWDTFQIEYTRGYDRDLNEWVPGAGDTLPDDIKLLQMMLVAWEWNKKGMEWVVEYKLGDETIKFGSVNGQSEQDTFFSFKTILDKYRTFTLP